MTHPIKFLDTFVAETEQKYLVNKKIKLVRIGPFLDFFLRLLKLFNHQFLLKNWKNGLIRTNF